MEDYKNYIMPGVALLLLLAWFFIIQPRMTGSDAPAPEPAPKAAADSAL